MLIDDAGELQPVKLDPHLVNSNNAVIVLDEYHDTCWVFIGRNVNMATRMHALRMSKSIKKMGFKIGVATIGMRTTKIVEMLEKNDSDPEVAKAIEEFRAVIEGEWSFDDEVLAFRPEGPKEPIAGAPVRAEEPVVTPEPAIEIDVQPTMAEEPTLTAKTIGEEITVPSLAEQKAALLLFSVIKHTDLTYSERFEKDGKMGVKIEAPGVLTIEALLEENDVSITPPDFGDSEVAKRVREEFESLTRKI